MLLLFAGGIPFLTNGARGDETNSTLPVHIAVGQALKPEEENRIGVAEGLVTFVGKQGRSMYLEISSETGHIPITVTHGSGYLADLLLNSRVRVQGVCVPIHSDVDGRIISGLSATNVNDITILRVGGEVWQEFPSHTIGEITVTNLRESTFHLYGTVQSVEAGRSFVLADGTGEEVLECRQAVPEMTGTEVEALCGFHLRGTNRVPPEGAGAHAREISSAAQQVIQSLDETVWAVNPRNDNLPHVFNYLSEFATEFLKVANVRCRLDFPDHPPAQTISAEARHNLFLAIKEALNNAARHAKATEVWLRGAADEESLVFSIEDNGRGFSGSCDSPSADGLRNMRQRMESIGGRFKIESAPETGTKVTLSYFWPPAE